MRLADFIYCLESQGMGLIDMQSDEAVELINQCLPPNMLIARIPPKEKDNATPETTKS
jgi:hypothetical protein